MHWPQQRPHVGTETNTHQDQPWHQHPQLSGGSLGNPARSQEVPRKSCWVPPSTSSLGDTGGGDPLHSASVQPSVNMCAHTAPICTCTCTCWGHTCAPSRVSASAHSHLGVIVAQQEPRLSGQRTLSVPPGQRVSQHGKLGCLARDCAAARVSSWGLATAGPSQAITSRGH